MNKWYNSKWFYIASLIIFFPINIIISFTNKHISLKYKAITWLIVIGTLTVLNLSNNKGIENNSIDQSISFHKNDTLKIGYDSIKNIIGTTYNKNKFKAYGKETDLIYSNKNFYATFYKGSNLILFKDNETNKVIYTSFDPVASKNKMISLNNEIKKEIETNFSAWDGSHIKLKRWIKDNMKDPDSYENVNTTYKEKNKNLIVTTIYRGKNSFGAKVINKCIAEVDKKTGRVIKILQH